MEDGDKDSGVAGVLYISGGGVWHKEFGEGVWRQELGDVDGEIPYGWVVAWEYDFTGDGLWQISGDEDTEHADGGACTCCKTLHISDETWKSSEDGDILLNCSINSVGTGAPESTILSISESAQI